VDAPIAKAGAKAETGAEAGDDVGDREDFSAGFLAVLLSILFLVVLAFFWFWSRNLPFDAAMNRQMIAYIIGAVYFALLVLIFFLRSRR